MSVYRDLLLSYGPSLYWPLDAVYGATDQSIGGHSGTAAGTGAVIGGHAATYAPITEEDASCSDLDGVDDRVESTYNPFTAGTTRTFLGWAYRDASATADSIFGGDVITVRPHLTLVAATDNVQWGSGTTNTTWTAGWPGNAQWVFWVLVYDDSTFNSSLYINGSFVSTRAPSGGYDVAPGNLKVGAREAVANNPFDGKLAHVAVVESALSLERVRRLWNAASESDAVVTESALGPGLYGPGAEDLALDVLG